MKAVTHAIHMRPVFVAMAVGCFFPFLGRPLAAAFLVIVCPPADVSVILAPGKIGFVVTVAGILVVRASVRPTECNLARDVTRSGHLDRGTHRHLRCRAVRPRLRCPYTFVTLGP
jgi:hypothetical protein